MKKLLLIRHGESEVNHIGKIHTVNDSAQLTKIGIKQAREAGIACEQESVTKIYTSPEIRAKQTAEIIADYLNEGVQTLANLRERNWGEWTSLSWGEIRTRLEKMSFEERYTFSPPGGESWQDMERRLQQAIALIKEESAATIAVITHGGTIRALMPILLKANQEESYKVDPTNGEIFIFTFNGSSFVLR